MMRLIFVYAFLFVANMHGHHVELPHRHDYLHLAHVHVSR